MRKKLLIPALVFSLFCCQVKAQKVTFDISGGYTVPLARQTEVQKEYVQNSATLPYFYSTSVTLRPVSYGQGGNVAVNLNWFSKKNIGFGLKLNAHIGAPFKHIATTTYVGYAEYYDNQSQAYSMQFIPHLCFRHDFKRVSPVLEMGMIIGATVIDHKYTITASGQSETIRTKVRDYGNTLLGFYSSLGLSINVSKVVKINLAVTCNAASYTPARWKRLSFTVDDVDRLSTLPAHIVQGKYASEWNLQGGERAKTSVAFSGVGFNTGICFVFPKGKNKKALPEKEDIRF